MIPELGHFTLILAFICALSLGGLAFISKKITTERMNKAVIALTQLQFVFVLLSLGALFWSFYVNDFSVKYVQENAHENLPVYYRLTAVWGAHEGSMLLWVTLFALWSYWVSIRAKSLPKIVHSRLLSILGMLSVGFILFLLLTSNPFIRFLPFFPSEGSDLNPLLQDPGLIVHPPLLYMGYVGLAVPFASQMCTLFFPEHAQVLAKWTRSWILCAWAFLTLGIVLGSYWAYYELGWGGYWFWDPVENASFMPWLVTAALAHSMIVTDKRGLFQAWSVLLAIYAFALSLVGTFLVRSGVLTSVHAFAVSPERGLYILIFLSFVIAVALSIFCVRVHTIKKQINFEGYSKEFILLINNLFLVVLASTILLGTLYPLFIDALFSEKLSVGAPYFNAVFVPMVLPLILIMGFAPSTKFYRDRLWPQVKSQLGWLMGLGSIAIIIMIYTRAFMFSLGILAGLWLIVATLKLGWQKFTHRSLLHSTTLGMLIAHLGVGVVVLGLSLTTQLSEEKDVDIALHEQVTIGNYHITFAQMQEVKGPNYDGLKATFLVEKLGQHVKTLRPEKRFYIPRNIPMTETAIDSNPLRDIYIALSEPTGEQSWAVRIYLKPFVSWIWIGGILIALGSGLSTLLLKRKRQARTSKMWQEIQDGT